MKTAAFVVLSALAILAADPAPETGPNFNEPSRRELPYPLPLDFNECVMVVWSEESKAQHGQTIGAWDPPHTERDIQNINRGMREGWGEYRYCNESPT